jgi:hypothetical protein
VARRQERTCSFAWEDSDGKVQSCVGKHYAKGWCQAHYRQKKSGRLMLPVRKYSMSQIPAVERQQGWMVEVNSWRGDGRAFKIQERARIRIAIEARVDKADDGECWPWKGGKTGSGRPTRVQRTDPQRWAYEEFKKRVLEEDEHIHLRCEDRSCMNPAHMFVSDHAQRLVKDYVPRDRRIIIPKCSNSSMHGPAVADGLCSLCFDEAQSDGDLTAVMSDDAPESSDAHDTLLERLARIRANAEARNRDA